MNIRDIAEGRKRKAVFNMVLEEACRQWCDFIEAVPERKDGEGFADFFYEIYEEKEKEYIRQVKELNDDQRSFLQSKSKNHER